LQELPNSGLTPAARLVVRGGIGIGCKNYQTAG
jgi:hypothetical protein